MTHLVDIKGRKVELGSTIQFIKRYGREINSKMIGRNAEVLGLTAQGRVKLGFWNSSSTFTVKSDRIADCAVLVQTAAPFNQNLQETAENRKSLELKQLETIDWVIKTLDWIDTLPIDNDTKEQLVSRAMDVIDFKKTIRKYTPGSQEKVIKSLRGRGGSAVRAEIASDSGLDPNAVSSLLNKLVKRGKVEKIPLDKPPTTSGRGLVPGYIYKLVDEEDDKAKTTKVAQKVS